MIYTDGERLMGDSNQELTEFALKVGLRPYKRRGGFRKRYYMIESGVLLKKVMLAGAKRLSAVDIVKRKRGF